MVDDGWSFYWANIRVTLSEAAWGYLWGNVLAIGLAFLVLVVPLLEKPVMQFGVVSYCIPVIAIGPILQITYNGQTPKVILAALFVFFTTLVGTMVGLRSAQPVMLDVVHAYGGGRVAELVKVRIRAALPSLFAALRIAAPAAILGAIIGEYLGGESGIGHRDDRLADGLRSDAHVGPRHRRRSSRVHRLRHHRLHRSCAHAVGTADRTMSATDSLLALEPEAITAPRAPGASDDGSKWWRVTKAVLWRLFTMIVGIVLILVVWQLFLEILHIDPFIGRGPSDVWDFLTTGQIGADARQQLWDASVTTLTDAGFGLFAGASVAVLVALVLQPRAVRRSRRSCRRPSCSGRCRSSP